MVWPWPGLPAGRDVFVTLVAVLGTTISPYLFFWQAAQEVEDKRFRSHFGVDPVRLTGAMIEGITGSRSRLGGTSTITQQLARNLFLTRERTLVRKVKEAILSVRMERTYSKDQILEMYLNFAQFGPRTYGAAAAAERSFRKAVRDLTPQESARLAAVLPNPEALSAAAPSPRVRSRADWIERQMGQLGAFYLDAIL